MIIEQEEFIKHMRSFRVAMLATESFDEPHRMRARPMTILSVHDEGTMLFATSNDSTLVEDLKKEHRALVTMQGLVTQASASGVCYLCGAERMDEVWSRELALFFESKEQAQIVEFRPHELEVWHQSAGGMKFVFEAARAWLAGETMRLDKTGEHGHRIMM